MARQNAAQSFAERRDVRPASSPHDRRPAAPVALEERTEAHSSASNIATIHGTSSVGSLVTFDEGLPAKAGYRHYRLRSVVGTDGLRPPWSRSSGGASAIRSGADFPNLLVIDGGLGQLGAARAALAELGVDLEAVALAKERVERDATASDIRRTPERVFVPGRKNPVVLRPNSSALFLLQRVRDEAHRFANTYHRSYAHRPGSPPRSMRSRAWARAGGGAAATFREPEARPRRDRRGAGERAGYHAHGRTRIKEQLGPAEARQPIDRRAAPPWRGGATPPGRRGAVGAGRGSAW